MWVCVYGPDKREQPNGRRAASKSKSGSGARWAVSSRRDWVKRRSTCANGGFDIDSDRETDSVRGLCRGEVTKATSPNKYTLGEFVSWPDRYVIQ